MVDDPKHVYAAAKRLRSERNAQEAEDARRAASLPGQADARLGELERHLLNEIPDGLAAKIERGPGGLHPNGIKGLTLTLMEDETKLGDGFITITSAAMTIIEYSWPGKTELMNLKSVPLSQLTEDHATELLNTMVRRFVA